VEIGHRVREIRKDLGMPAAELARRVGTSRNHIVMIEAGSRTPSVGLLEKIARELRTEPAEFFKEPAVPLDEAPTLTGPRPEWRVPPGTEYEYGPPPALHEDFVGAFWRLVKGQRDLGMDDAAIERDILTTVRGEIDKMRTS
jgi:transcriptional regulator with XRE-family HTH domain